VTTPGTAVERHAWSWTLRPRYVGWFFLWTSGIHVGIVAADTAFYRHFADGALIPGLAGAWRSMYMPHAAITGLLVAAGEAVVALLLLLGSRTWRRIGWIGMIAFHTALLCFGWGFWLWSIPALVVLVRSSLEDWRTSDGPWSSPQVTVVGHTR